MNPAIMALFELASTLGKLGVDLYEQRHATTEEIQKDLADAKAKANLTFAHLADTMAQRDAATDKAMDEKETLIMEHLTAPDKA